METVAGAPAFAVRSAGTTDAGVIADTEESAEESNGLSSTALCITLIEVRL